MLEYMERPCAKGGNVTENEQLPSEEPLSEDIKMIIGGIAGLVLIVVPVILVRKIVRTVEENDLFKTFERKLS